MLKCHTLCPNFTELPDYIHVGLYKFVTLLSKDNIDTSLYTCM